MTAWQYWLLVGLIVFMGYTSERRFDELIRRLDGLENRLGDEPGGE